MTHHIEPRGFHPLAHGLGRKPEPAVGMLIAQEFERVGCKIDHDPGVRKRIGERQQIAELRRVEPRVEGEVVIGGPRLALHFKVPERGDARR